MVCVGRYLFGEPVKGVGFVVFGLIEGNDRTSFPGSLQRVEVCACNMGGSIFG